MGDVGGLVDLLVNVGGNVFLIVLCIGVVYFCYVEDKVVYLVEEVGLVYVLLIFIVFWNVVVCVE